MSHSQHSLGRAAAQEGKPDVSQLVLSAEAIFNVAVRNFVKESSPKFQVLVTLKDGIIELRERGASYRDIAELVTKAGIPMSHQTVARFCRAVTRKVSRRSKRKNSSVTALSSQSFAHALEVTQKKAQAGKTDATQKRAPDATPVSRPSSINSNPYVPSRKRRGPRIADPKNV